MASEDVPLLDNTHGTSIPKSVIRTPILATAMGESVDIDDPGRSIILKKSTPKTILQESNHGRGGYAQKNSMSANIRQVRHVHPFFIIVNKISLL